MRHTSKVIDQLKALIGLGEKAVKVKKYKSKKLRAAGVY